MKQTSRLCMLTVVNDVSACGATYFIMSALWCMINKVCKTADITTKYIQSFRCYYFENNKTWKKRVWNIKYVLRFSQRNYSQVLFLSFAVSKIRRITCKFTYIYTEICLGVYVRTTNCCATKTNVLYSFLDLT